MTTVVRLESFKFSSILKVNTFCSKFRKHKTVVIEKPFLISIHISGRLYCPKNNYESPSDLLYCCDILLFSNAYMKSDVETK